jgi:hypothetical protein
MPQTSDTALLILDFQVGIGDQPYAKSAAQRAAKLSTLCESICSVNKL